MKHRAPLPYAMDAPDRHSGQTNVCHFKNRESHIVRFDILKTSKKSLEHSWGCEVGDRYG